LTTLIVRRSVVHSVTPPHLSLSAPLAMSMGDLTTVPPPPELFATDDSAPETIGARGVSTRGSGGAHVIGAGGGDATGVGDTGSTGARWE
jgi:hypothetical protein